MFPSFACETSWRAGMVLRLVRFSGVSAGLAWKPAAASHGSVSLASRRGIAAQPVSGRATISASITTFLATFLEIFISHLRSLTCRALLGWHAGVSVLSWQDTVHP